MAKQSAPGMAREAPTREFANSIAWTIVVFAVLATVVRVALVVLVPGRSNVGSPIVDALQPLPWLGIATLGALIVRRRSAVTIGWLFLGAATQVVYFLCRRYAESATEIGLPPSAVITWLATWTFLPAALIFSTLVPLLLPSGQLASPRWRPVLWLSLAALAFGSVSLMIRPGPLDPPYDLTPNPLGVAGYPTAAFPAAVLLWILAAIGSVWSFNSRVRRSRGIERLQLRWFAYGFGLLVALLGFALVGTLTVGPAGLGPLAGPLQILALSVVAIASGIAMLRYRLFDIDLVVRHTVVYGALTALLAGTYVTVVLLTQAVLRPVTSGAELAVAVSTLATLTLLQPLRRGVQQAVDRRFYRSRYDAARSLDAFSTRLRDEVDLDAVRADLLNVVHETVRPVHASVWLRRTN